MISDLVPEISENNPSVEEEPVIPTPDPDDSDKEPVDPIPEPEDPPIEDPIPIDPDPNSILYTIKQGIGGIDPSVTVFDANLIIHINSVFFILNQFGVGDDRYFRITGPNETWQDFLGDKIDEIELIKSYMCLKVKLLFDPPSTGVLHEAMERQINEFEWRINEQMDLNKNRKEELTDEPLDDIVDSECE